MKVSTITEKKGRINEIRTTGVGKWVKAGFF